MRIPILLVFTLLASAAGAQPQRTIQGLFIRSSNGGSNGQAAWGSAQIEAPVVGPSPVIGAPFSGQETQRSVQTLPDGTRITRPQSSGAKVFRDSEGRTRVERSLFPATLARPGFTAPAPIEIVEINDPNQGVYYLLDTSKKVAYRMTYAPAPPNRNKQGQPRPTSAPPGNQTNTQGIRTTTEELGLRIVNGVQAEGRRRTTILPENFQGNDRPLTQVSEDWIAVGLQIPVLSISNSPQGGESTFELINVSLASPTPLLFSPPAEYTIQDRQSPFTVEFGQKPAGPAVFIRPTPQPGKE